MKFNYEAYAKLYPREDKKIKENTTPQEDRMIEEVEEDEKPIEEIVDVEEPIDNNNI